MPVPASIVEYLKLREGWREQVYTDTRGNATAGMGHLLNASERSVYAAGDTVPASLLQTWALADSGRAYKAALGQADMLGLARDAGFVTVLTSVNFQLGTNWRAKFPRTWREMLRRRWMDAAVMVARSRWAAQTPARARDLIDALSRIGRAEGRRRARTVAGMAVAGALAMLLASTVAAASLGHGQDAKPMNPTQ